MKRLLRLGMRLADGRSSDDLKVGGEYELFNMTKESPVKLKMPKNSYAKKIKMLKDQDDVEEPIEKGFLQTIRLSDLMKKKRKATVQETLIAKVFEIKEETKTSKGTRIW